jgi:hypothetical protein
MAYELIDGNMEFSLTAINFLFVFGDMQSEKHSNGECHHARSFPLSCITK